MVSGLVTSPELQLRICLDEAKLISMASNLFMSSILCALSLAGESGNCCWVLTSPGPRLRRLPDCLTSPGPRLRRLPDYWLSLCGALAFQALQIDVRGGVDVEQLLDGDRLDLVDDVLDGVILLAIRGLGRALRGLRR